MNANDQAFLFDLLSTPSPTGFEVRGQKKWMQYVKKHSDSVENDAYGTAWATVEGDKKGTTIMLEAHADEIGYITKCITKEGFIHVDRIGGSDVAVARGRRISILTEKGDIDGIIGNTAIHIRDRENDELAPKIHELYVDVGAKNEKEVEKMGIRVGQPAVCTDPPMRMGKKAVVGRALDNRLGSFIISQVLRNVHDQKKKHDCTVYGVNAVQEEIGGYGAKMVTHRLLPSIAIVLDVCHATDTPGIEKAKHGHVLLGKGPTVTHGTCNHPKLVERFMEIAKKKDIPLQHESSSRYSGTDTDQVYHIQEGVPSALISIPLRYMHSVVEMAHLDDIDHTIKLLTEFVRSVKQSDTFGLEL